MSTMRETHLLLHILQYFDAYRVFKLPGNMRMMHTLEKKLETLVLIQNTKSSHSNFIQFVAHISDLYPVLVLNLS